MKLSIPNPCPANWNEMIPTDNGRYCSVCEKVVVDFTKMNEEEIKLFFLSRSPGKLCGRANAFDLSEKPKNIIQSLVISAYQRSKRIHHTMPRNLSLLVLGAALILLGCGPTSGEMKVSMDRRVEDSIRVADSLGNIAAQAELDRMYKEYREDSIKNATK